MICLCLQVKIPVPFSLLFQTVGVAEYTSQRDGYGEIAALKLAGGRMESLGGTCMSFENRTKLLLKNVQKREHLPMFNFLKLLFKHIMGEVLG